MSEHRAQVEWKRETNDFQYETYNRKHIWRFEGGIEVPASSAPEFLGDADRVDPEKGLVACLSACHMLTFLALAAKKRLMVDSYADSAVGVMEKNKDGQLAVTNVTLNPKVKFGGDKKPNEEELKKLHSLAHKHCFIANSVKSEVTVHPELST